MLGSHNTRYVNYARVHGRTPDEMLNEDSIRYPGLCMHRFALWNRSHLRAFYAEHPEAFYRSPGDPPWLVDHAAYDAYLDALPVLSAHSTAETTP